MSCVASSPHFFFVRIPTSAAAPATASTVPPTTTIPAPAITAPRTPSARKTYENYFQPPLQTNNKMRRFIGAVTRR